eukprot:2687674-Karenia_brevis.AAC.1
MLQHNSQWVPTKPYSLQKDGDLWRIFHQAILQRGPQTSAVTKVKGHAATEQVQHSEELMTHKKHNDRADHIA